MIEFLCERELTTGASDDSKTVKVSIGKPEKANENEFACPFRITGLGNSDVQYGRGIDCFQALIMALEGIRASLERAGNSLTWAGGQQGEHGFPRFVPSFYGVDFSRHIDELIETEIRRFAQRAQRES
jgi:hypothetical protein